MDENDPKSWREAQDAKTGRTYYYHRVTRLSRWTKPPCLMTPEENHERLSNDSVSLSAEHNHHNQASTVEAVAEQKFSNRDIVGDSTQLHFHAVLTSAVGNLTAMDDNNAVIDALLLIASRCGVSVETTLHLATEDNLINNLVVLMMRGTTIQCRRLSLRILCALAYCVETAECFCTNQSWVILASKAGRWVIGEIPTVGTNSSSSGGHSSTTNSSSSSGTVDRESALLYCCFISYLLGGPAREVIGTELERTLCELLMIKKTLQRGPLDVTCLRLLTVHMSGGAMGDEGEDENSGWGVLQALQSLASVTGRMLPGLVFLEISEAVLSTTTSSPTSSLLSDDQTEERIEAFLLVWGGLSCLQGLVTGRHVVDQVRAKARALLLQCLARFEFVRERVLNGYASLTMDLSALSLPTSPPSSSSSLSSPSFTAPTTQSMMTMMMMCDVVWTVQRRKTIDLVAGSSGATCASWRLPSATVYARCPGLRPVIAEFVDNRAAAAAVAADDGDDDDTNARHHHHRAPVLRLAFSGSVTALAAVCAYIHTGVLALPSPFDAIVNVKSHPLLDAEEEEEEEEVDTFRAPGFGSDLAVDVGSVNQLQVLLELVKTATELGMVALKAAALDCVLLSLTDANVDETELFCRSRGGLGDMVEVCRLFRLRRSSPPSSSAAAAMTTDHAASSRSHAAHARTRARASSEGSTGEDCLDDGRAAVTGAGAGVVSGPKKPKPGGIYGLLLKDKGEHRVGEGPSVSGDGEAEEKNAPCYSYNTSAKRSIRAYPSHEEEEEDDDAGYAMSSSAPGGGALETTLIQSPDAARGHHYHYHSSLINGSSSAFDGHGSTSPRHAAATTIPPHLRPKAAFGRAASAASSLLPDANNPPSSAASMMTTTAAAMMMSVSSSFERQLDHRSRSSSSSSSKQPSQHHQQRMVAAAAAATSHRVVTRDSRERDKDGGHAVGSSRESLDSGRDPRDIRASRETADSSSVGHVRRSRESEAEAPSRNKTRAMSADGRAARRAELGLPLSSSLGIAAEGHVVSSSSSSSSGGPGSSAATSPKRNNHNHSSSSSSSSSKYSSTGRVMIKPAGLDVNLPPHTVAGGPFMRSLSTADDNGDDCDDARPLQQGRAVNRIENNQPIYRNNDRDGEGGRSIVTSPAASDHPSPTYPPSPALKPRPTQSPLGSAGVGMESVSAVRQSLTLLKTKARRKSASGASFPSCSSSVPSSPTSTATTGKLSHHHQPQQQQHHRYHHRGGGSQSNNGITSEDEEEEEEEEEEEDDDDAMRGPGGSYLRDFNRHHGSGSGSSGRLLREGGYYDMNNNDDNASIASANSALTTLSAPAALSHPHPHSSSTMRHPIGTATAAASRTASVVVNSSRGSRPPPSTAQSQSQSQPVTMAMANATAAAAAATAVRGGSHATLSTTTRPQGAWETATATATVQTPSRSSSSSHRGLRDAPGTPSRGGVSGPSLPATPNPNTPSKWKQQSEMFRQAMKSSRDVTKALESGAPLPPSVASAPDPSLIPCPHCGRRFNEKAADRHIPQCQNIKAKPKVLLKGSGGAGMGTLAVSTPNPASGSSSSSSHHHRPTDRPLPSAAASSSATGGSSSLNNGAMQW